MGIVTFFQQWVDLKNDFTKLPNLAACITTGCARGVLLQLDLQHIIMMPKFRHIYDCNALLFTLAWCLDNHAIKMDYCVYQIILCVNLVYIIFECA